MVYRKNVTVLMLMLLLSSCATHVRIEGCVSGQHIYGFWGGLWHGVIAPFSLISMLWSDNVVYAANNNGGWYAVGFCLGAGILGWGSSKSKK